MPAAWIRQPALPWPGEEGGHVKPGEGGRREGGKGLTEQSGVGGWPGGGGL